MIVKERERGVAMIESAIFLPVLLLLMFGIIWAVQSSVQSERVQIAVRYSGLVSNQAAPYVGYSLYDLYNAAASPSVSTNCSAPTIDALNNTGSFPGPAAQPFWQPIGGTTNGNCTKGTALLQGGSLSTPMLLMQTTSSVSTQVQIPSYLQATLGNSQNLSAAQNFFDTPDLGTIMQCYGELRTAVAQSLADTSVGAVSAAAPLPDSNSTAPLAIGSC